LCSKELSLDFTGVIMNDLVQLFEEMAMNTAFGSRDQNSYAKAIDASQLTSNYKQVLLERDENALNALLGTTQPKAIIKATKIA
jgi:hypothetical protein